MSLYEKIIACVAGGPSLTAEDCSVLSEAGFPSIAVNNSWQIIPSCLAIYAADCCWWEENHSTIDSPAERWCGDAFTARRFGINCLPSALPGSFNSGQRAIELAIHLGAKTVLLVGYDCSVRRGVHWHGRHAQLANPDAFSVNRWQSEFEQLKAWARGVEIINCSRSTRLRCFPKMRLETALERLLSETGPRRSDLPLLTT
ncbi:TPA: hypothetical protein MX214_003967 [Citrobacter sedlakii]|nr:hypothetical protein [Citrobacter sedlakii]HCA7134031.1 hypothetical protein [Citrobacter sedlakii]HCA7180165.1 hypothetical protein [Citrobacter sedlakii]